jgi:hypothetical protein
MEKWRYILHTLLIMALFGGGRSVLLSGHFILMGEAPRYPLDRTLGGPQSRSGRYGEERNIDPVGNVKAASVV